MSQQQPLSQEPVDRNLLRILARHCRWDSELVEQIFFETAIYPGKDGWRKFLDRFLLATGAVLMLTGIIFFFAYNWADMPKFAKLGLVELLVLASATWAWLRPPGNFSFKIALTALSVLAGALIAVYGQIYQTGANAYDFFLGWTLLISAWVLISRFPPLWFFYLVLLNTTMILFGLQVLRLWDQPYALWAVVGLNLLAWVGFEYLTLKKGVDNPARWLTRLTGLGTLVFLTVLGTYAMVELTEGHAKTGSPLSLLLCALIWAAALWIFRNYIRDLFFLALVPISVMVVGITGIALVLDDPWEFTLFLCGGLVIGGTAGMVRWLMHVHRSWQNPPLPSKEKNG